MNARIRSVAQVALFVAVAFTSTPVLAVCPAVTHAALTAALTGALGGNGGLSNNMWATIVDRDGVVCLVTKTGAAGAQWPGSRVISAQKANTGNAFSLPPGQVGGIPGIPGLALSTANLYSAVQPAAACTGYNIAIQLTQRSPIRAPR